MTIAAASTNIITTIAAAATTIAAAATTIATVTVTAPAPPAAKRKWKSTSKDIVFLIISAVLIGVSFLIPAGIFRTLVQAAATLLIGWKMFWEGLKGLVHFSLDEMTLMTVAVVAAFAIGEGFEGAMVTILFQIGELFENRAVMKSRQAH